MNQLRFSLLAIIIISATACKKETEILPAASINIIHASVNLSAIKVNYFGSAITWATYNDSIRYGFNKAYTVAANEEAKINIVRNSDTGTVLLNGSFKTEPGGVYSLYLCGQSSSVDTLWAKENITNYKDSIVGIRFINLCPNSDLINVNLTGGSSIAEFTNLPYRRTALFRTFPALSTNTSYVFEIRNATTSDLITTYTFNVSGSTRFHNQTLVIRGLIGGTGTAAPGVFMVNNY